MSFNQLLVDQPEPEIAGSAVVVGEVHVGAGAILAVASVLSDSPSQCLEPLLQSLAEFSYVATRKFGVSVAWCVGV